MLRTRYKERDREGTPRPRLWPLPECFPDGRGICRLFVIASGAVLGVLAGLVFMASIVLFFKAGVIAGLSWLAIAFLISPYGLPMATAWLTGKIGGLNYALRDFLAS